MNSKFRTFARTATIAGAVATATSASAHGFGGHWSTGLTGHMETNRKTVQEDRRPMANGRRDFDREFCRWHRHRRHLVQPLIKGPGPVVPGVNTRPAMAQ
jgi:hypothetical protein